MKAGLMEIADVFAVNKSDRPEADRMIQDLTNMVALNPHDESSWIIPVKRTEAVRDVGIDDLLEAIEGHQKYLTQSGKRIHKAREFLKNEIADILSERLNNSIFATLETSSGLEVLDQVLSRDLDPYRAADLISGI
jgi:LAO/AO transport system kinase